MIHPPSSSVRKGLISTFKKNDEPSPSSQTTEERLQSTPAPLDAPTTEERLKSGLSTYERLMNGADQDDSGNKNRSQNDGDQSQMSILEATPVARITTDDVFQGKFVQLDTDQNGLLDANELMAGQEQGLVGYGGTTGTQEQFDEMLGSVGRQNGLTETEFVNNKQYFAPASQERKDFEYKYAWLQENRPDMAAVPDETLRALAGFGVINEDGSVSFNENGFYGEVGNLNETETDPATVDHTYDDIDDSEPVSVYLPPGRTESMQAELTNGYATAAETMLANALASGKPIRITDITNSDAVLSNRAAYGIPEPVEKPNAAMIAASSGAWNTTEEPILTPEQAQEIVANIRAKANAVTERAAARETARNELGGMGNSEGLPDGFMQVDPDMANNAMGGDEHSLVYGNVLYYHPKYGFVTPVGNWAGGKPSDFDKFAFGAMGVIATFATAGAASPLVVGLGGVMAGSSFALAQGADIGDAMEAGLTGAVTAGLGSWAAPQLSGVLGIDSTLGQGLVQGGVEAGVGTALNGGNIDDFGDTFVTNSAGVLGASAGNYVTGGLIEAGVNPAIAAGAGQATGTIVADGIDGGIEDLDDTLQVAAANGLGTTANVAVTNSMVANGADLPDAQSAGNATSAVVTGVVADDEVPNIAVAALDGATRPQIQAQETETAEEEDPGDFAAGGIADTTITDEDTTLINDENTENQPPSVFNSGSESNSESSESETYPADLPTPSTPEPLPANEAVTGPQTHPQQGSMDDALALGYGGYTVQDGNTLSSISQQTGVSVEDLIAANPQISDPDIIRPGDVVNVPLPGSSPQINQPGLPIENSTSPAEGNTTTETAWTESPTLFDGSDMDGGTTYTDGTVMQYNSATGEWAPMDFGNGQTHGEQLSTVLGLLSLSGIVFPPASLLAAGTGIFYAAMDDNVSLGTYASAGSNVLGVTSAMYNPIANTITLVTEGGSFLIWAGKDGVGQEEEFPEIQVDGP